MNSRSRCNLSIWPGVARMLTQPLRSPSTRILVNEVEAELSLAAQPQMYTTSFPCTSLVETITAYPGSREETQTPSLAKVTVWKSMWDRTYYCDHLDRTQWASVPQQLLLDSKSFTKYEQIGIGRVPRGFLDFLLCSFLLSGALLLKVQPHSSLKFQSVFPVFNKTATFYLALFSCTVAGKLPQAGHQGKCRAQFLYLPLGSQSNVVLHAI